MRLKDGNTNVEPMARDRWRTLSLGALITAGLMTACGNKREDVELLCDAEARWAADTKPGEAMDPGQRPRMAFAWAIEHIKTSEVRKSAEAIAGMAGSTQIESLREEAKAVGLTACPFADSLEKRLQNAKP